jgi:hypothetical protein
MTAFFLFFAHAPICQYWRLLGQSGGAVDSSNHLRSISNNCEIDRAAHQMTVILEKVLDGSTYVWHGSVGWKPPQSSLIDFMICPSKESYHDLNTLDIVSWTFVVIETHFYSRPRFRAETLARSPLLFVADDRHLNGCSVVTIRIAQKPCNFSLIYRVLIQFMFDVLDITF